MRVARHDAAAVAAAVSPHVGYLLSEQAAVVDGGQVSVVDLDQLVQVFSLLDLVLELQTRAVQDLPGHVHREGVLRRLNVGLAESTALRYCGTSPSLCFCTRLTKIHPKRRI